MPGSLRYRVPERSRREQKASKRPKLVIAIPALKHLPWVQRKLAQALTPSL